MLFQILALRCIQSSWSGKVLKLSTKTLATVRLIVFDDKYKTETHKALRGPIAPPLLYIGRVQQVPQGQAIGSFAPRQTEMDHIARAVGGKIYVGLIDCPYSHAYLYMSRYRDWIPRHPDF